MSNELSPNTITKGLTILNLVATQGNPRGVPLGYISDKLKMSKSTVYRYLTILCAEGWLERDDETLRYQIGAKMLQITSASLNQFDLRTRANPFLQKLATETNLVVHLATLHPPLIVYLDKFESASLPQMRSRPGLTGFCYSTAVGKALLTTMTDREIRSMLPPVLEARTPNTITNIEDLLKQLEQARRERYTNEIEEDEIGVGCVGAPIFRFDGQMVGAISLSGYADDFTPERIQNLGYRVAVTADKISQALGCFEFKQRELKKVTIPVLQYKAP